MSKIIIPKTGLYRVFRNTFEVDPVLLAKLKPEETLNLFTNDENHYILQIPNSVNSVQSKTPTVFRKLNIHGTFEIKSNCDFRLDISEYVNGNLNKAIYNHHDRLNCKNLIITIPRNFKGEPTCADIAITDEHLKKQDQTIETISVTAAKAELRLQELLKLKELTVDAEDIRIDNSAMPNLKKLNLPHLKVFKVEEGWKHGIDIFKRYDSSTWDDDLEITSEVNYDFIPDSCVIKLPLDCELSSEQRLHSKYPNLSQDLTVNKIKMKDFINSSTAKSFVNNNDGTFDIKFQEFKLLVADQLLKKVETSIKRSRELWKTEKQISDSMIKPSKESIKIK